MICQSCQQQGSQDAKYCVSCGQPFAYVPQPQRLYRPRYGRVAAGVCAGFAERYGWDPILVRLALAAIVLFGCGAPILLYFVAWIVMPNGPYLTTMPAPQGPAETQVVA